MLNLKVTKAYMSLIRAVIVQAQKDYARGEKAKAMGKSPDKHYRSAKIFLNGDLCKSYQETLSEWARLYEEAENKKKGKYLNG